PTGTLAPSAEVLRPNGTTISFCSPCSLAATGTYAVLVEDFGAGSGDYALTLQRLNNPVGCTAIGFGAAPTTGAIAAGETDCFTFTGAAGVQVHVDVAPASGAAPAD